MYKLKVTEKDQLWVWDSSVEDWCYVLTDPGLYDAVNLYDTPRGDEWAQSDQTSTGVYGKNLYIETDAQHDLIYVIYFYTALLRRQLC